ILRQLPSTSTWVSGWQSASLIGISFVLVASYVLASSDRLDPVASPAGSFWHASEFEKSRQSLSFLRMAVDDSSCNDVDDQGDHEQHQTGCNQLGLSLSESFWEVQSDFCRDCAVSPCSNQRSGKPTRSEHHGGGHGVTECSPQRQHD